MTLFVVFVMVFGLGLAVGHGVGFDRGVQQTEALMLLRAAFQRPMVRGRRGT